MREFCRIRQGLFDRWYIFHPFFKRERAWSGSRWVGCDAQGLPADNVQVVNFDSEKHAREYCREVDLKPIEK